MVSEKPQTLNGVPAKVQAMTMKEAVKSMWRFFANKRFLILAPQCFWTGVSIAYYSGNLVEMMSNALEEEGYDDSYQFKWSMIAMVLFGIGEILGCFYIGFIVDRWGSKKAAFHNMVIIVIMGAITMGFISQYRFNSLAYLMCFMWGFQDSSVNTHT